jgi:hypothetical protein
LALNRLSEPAEQPVNEVVYTPAPPMTAPMTTSAENAQVT